MLTSLATAQELSLPGLTEETSEATLDTPISTADTAVNDVQIKERLTNIYANFENLRPVQVTVEDGVVTLSGTVLQREAISQAQQLANRTENVVSVVNNIKFNQNVTQKLGFVFDQLIQRSIDIVQFLPILVVATIVFLVLFWLARVVTRRRETFQRFAANAFIADLIRQAVRIAITLFGLILALQIADATSILGSVLGALGLVGLAIGFAIRDTVENYIASILLSLRQPFAPNDHIRIDDKEGLVQRLTARATILMDFSGNHIRIPNATVFKGVITNFSRNPNRRFEFDVGVGVDVNLAEALATAKQTLLEIPGILADPAPLTSIQTLGDSNVVIRCYAWLNQKNSNYLLVRSEAIRLIKTRFEAAEFDMPEPIYRLHIQDYRRPASISHQATLNAKTATLSTLDDTAEAPEQPKTPTLRKAPPPGEPVQAQPMTLDNAPDQVIKQQSVQAQAQSSQPEDNLLSHDAPIE